MLQPKASVHVHLWALVGALCISACGGRTAPSLSVADGGPGADVERCDSRDNDDDGRVDEQFRDSAGRYVDRDHCGRCGDACVEMLPAATEVECALVADRPRCVAKGCLPGFALSESGRCVSIAEQLCMPCVSDVDCQALPGARCTTVGGLPHCTIDCAAGCPADYPCGRDDLGIEACLPMGGDCSCDPDEQFTIACAPEGRRDCAGRQRCELGVRSACEIPEELCDAIDNDCDGLIDEEFVDDRGAYTLDPAHCGRCGVDCNAGLDDELQLTCGGDPFAPSCVVRCPDIDDGGVQVGDRIDADGVLDNGCECLVESLTDEVGLDGSVIDPNCDGADGDVTRSVYVATDGNDLGPGSPSRPMRTISQALRTAVLSLGTALPRPDVFVAAGTYTESVEMQQGVRLHAGYRSDFLALDAGSFEVHVVAPVDTVAPHGAALVLDGVTDALVEGLRVTGVDRLELGAPAVGVLVRNASSNVTLRQLDVRSGRPGGGDTGATGDNGAPPTTMAATGTPQRAALEDAQHVCLASPDNVSRGGNAGRSVCGGGIDVSGGDGGSAPCPGFNVASEGGQDGNPALNVIGGGGGGGGDGVGAPLGFGQSCQSPPCCGLADYYVGFGYEEATAGQPGRDGLSGLAGAACGDALGSFAGLIWQPDAGASGVAGQPGSGGGGGGGGGGSEFAWNPVNACTYTDGLGGSGGGGGGGGCGGSPGAAGGAGGPAIGILVIAGSAAQQPRLVDCSIASENGGRGGDGGGGGDGGLGGAGGLGGVLPRDQRITPTLAGAQPGARGGKGGNGGPGGGGGGGCGGPSIGVWVTGQGSGSDSLNYGTLNRFATGLGGQAGRGGGGAVPAADGATGTRTNVLVR